MRDTTCSDCGEKGVTRYYNLKYCKRCGDNRFKSNVKQEEEYFSWVDKTYDEWHITYNRIIDPLTCNRRPDIYFHWEVRKVIVEIDERQHKGKFRYDGEHQRMVEIATNIKPDIPTIFIRFNPDAYHDEEGVTRKISKEQRLEKLKKEIDRWLDPEAELPYPCTAVYLYYDGPVRRVEQINVS
jgi:hypothetical protein